MRAASGRFRCSLITGIGKIARSAPSRSVNGFCRHRGPAEPGSLCRRPPHRPKLALVHSESSVLARQLVGEGALLASTSWPITAWQTNG
jgi:hypothetical protein